jgi:P27 family predicted phage terminase small subunit
LRPEVQPERTSQCPEPPDHLSELAQEEWRRVAPQLHRLGLLTIVDVMVLAAYCSSYARWRSAEEALARMAARDELTAALLIKAPDGSARANPLTRTSRDAAEAMLRYAGEFGMTPVARSRLAAGIGPEPPRGGKFSGLLGDGGPRAG